MLIFLIPIFFGGFRGWLKSSDGLTISPANQMTMVIGTPFAISVSGKVAYAQGSDICPDGEAADARKMECIVVAPETQSVRVKLVLDGALTEEIWKVERNDAQTLLRRPDGSPVVAASAAKEK